MPTEEDVDRGIAFALHRIDTLTAEVAALRNDHIALGNVSGALCDAGGIVPGETWRYGEAVRAIVAERDALRVALDKDASDIEALVMERDAFQAEVAALREALDRLTREGSDDGL